MSEITVSSLAAQLNKWLDQAIKSDERYIGHIPFVNDMINLLHENSILLIQFHEALVLHGEELIESAVAERPELRDIIKEIYETSIAKSVAVMEHNYELAAKLRDTERKLREQVEQKIIEINHFIDVFNPFGDQIIVIQPKDHQRRKILSVVLHNLEQYKKW